MGAATALPISRGATSPVAMPMLLLVILGQIPVVLLLTSSAWAMEGVFYAGEPDVSRPTPGGTSTTHSLLLCGKKARSTESETCGGQPTWPDAG